MLCSPGIKSIRNSVLTSQLFLREDNKDRQAVWRLEFVHAPMLLGALAGLRAFVEAQESCTL